jgi:50S ribosomal subunit-associated GTPase HflX
VDRIPCLRVLNKQDVLPSSEVERCVNVYGGIAISANDKSTLVPLIDAMSHLIDQR